MRYMWVLFFVLFMFPYSMIYSGPGLMGFLTLIITFMSSLLVGLTRSSWYGISVWLVYISGMLVLFLFFCSLTPNPSFYNRYMKIFSVFLFMSFLGCISFIEDCHLEFVKSDLLWELQPFFLLEGSGVFIYCWMGAYLFFVMILVVKMSPKMGGAYN